MRGYDIERDPGRSHEGPPRPATEPVSASPALKSAAGSVGIFLAESPGNELSGNAESQSNAVAQHGTQADALTASATALAEPSKNTKVGILTSEATALAQSSDDTGPSFAGTARPSGTGGGMSLQDTMQQVAALQRSIQDQMQMVNDFLRSNRETVQMVTSELKGSTKGYDQQMLSALSQAESSLTSSLGSLRQASDALDSVRSI